MDYGAVDPKFVDYLKVPFLVYVISPLQILDRVQRLAIQKVDQSLSSLFHFFMPSTSFLTLVVAGSLLFLVASVLFSCFEKPSISLPSRLWLPTGRKLRLKIISFFYLLFMFFNGQFFEGNLNTENIMVRTDDLLHSIEQVLRTQKEPCFVEGGAEMDFYKNVSYAYNYKLISFGWSSL